MDGHVASVAKDRTTLFGGQHFTPSLETGTRLRGWLDSAADPLEASRIVLAGLTERVEEIDNIPHLENWWRAHKSDIDTLTPPDLETLKAFCAERKAAILAVWKAATEAPTEAAGGTPSLPTTSTGKPPSRRKGKGNGGAVAEAA